MAALTATDGAFGEDFAMATHPRSASLPFVLTALLVGMPARTPAQDLAASDVACSMDMVPNELGAGVSVVEVRARLSRSVGRTLELRAPRESGIELSSRERLEWLFAGEDEEGGAPQPIEAGRDARGATLWLNLLAANPGTHRLVLRGEGGACTGEVTVRGPGGDG